MRNIIDTLKNAARALGLAFSLGAATCAQADSFNMTNGLVGPMNLNSYPTNTPVTNSTSAGQAVGVATGKQIDMVNYKDGMLYFHALPVVTNGVPFTNTIALARGDSEGPPVVTLATNGSGVVTYSDWATTNFQYISFVTPGNSNAINWSTNLSGSDVGSAHWLGMVAYSNNTIATATFTNVDAGIKKKILPIRYP